LLYVIILSQKCAVQLDDLPTVVAFVVRVDIERSYLCEEDIKQKSFLDSYD
jgi:hypothetical protein